MGDGTKNGIILGLDKAAKERDVGLGLKMQRKDSYFSKKMIGMPHHPYHQLRSSSPSGSLSGSGGGGRGGGGGGSGAFFCNQVAYFSDVSDVVGAAGALPKNLHHYKSETTFNSPVPVSMRIPFTAAQWQELERQTIIYKYILASAPVPPELLFPITKSRSNVHASHPNRLGYSSATDPEPWRCRRTDGKKWRCSRDVIPDQKYCERHIHKNRPRSRKPVESIAELKKAFPLNLAADNFLKQTNTHIRSPLETMVSASSYDQSRSPTWFLKRETAPVASANHQWQQLMQPNVGMKRDEFVLQHQEEEVEPVMGNEQELKNDQCSLILGQKLGTLTERPRDFIDAWSTAERDHRVDNSYNKCSASSNGKLPLSSLTLSMSGVDESNGQRDAQIGLGFMDSDRENGGGGVKCQPLHNWMNPGSWMSSPPGGPLAEALCLGIASRAPSNTESPRGSSSSSKSSRGESSQGFGSIK